MNAACLPVAAISRTPLRKARLVSALMLTLLCLLAAGCKSNQDISPSGGLGDPVPAPMNDPTITVLSPELRPWLFFHPAIIVRDEHRPMSVEVPVRNAAARMYLIEYRIIFYDENGAEISPVMGWEFQELHPKQLVRLKRRALSTDAKTYRLEVKWSE